MRKIQGKTNIGERATTKITKQQQGEQTTTTMHNHPSTTTHKASFNLMVINDEIQIYRMKTIYIYIYILFFG